MANTGKNRRSPEVIVFEKRPFKVPVLQNKERKAACKSSVESEMPQMEFDMQKARYEVLKFGMKGFDKEKQKKDKISMAIKLGAKPPKKEYKNYKELMAEKKVQKEEEVADRLLRQYCLEVLKQNKKTRRPRPVNKMKKMKKRNNKQ